MRTFQSLLRGQGTSFSLGAVLSFLTCSANCSVPGICRREGKQAAPPGWWLGGGGGGIHQCVSSPLAPLLTPLLPPSLLLPDATSPPLEAWGHSGNANPKLEEGRRVICLNRFWVRSLQAHRLRQDKPGGEGRRGARPE